MTSSTPNVTLLHGDCLDVLKTLADNSLDACVTDPPYGLSDHDVGEVAECLRAWMEGRPYLTKNRGGFLGRSWDAWVPGPEVWREVLRVLKPGGHLLCFAGTRSMDLMSMAIRIAGFEMRDAIGSTHADAGGAPLLAWVYGCLDAESEALTPHGWVRGTDLKAGTPVRQWDPVTGDFSWVVPSRLINRDYVGPMIRLGGIADQLLTPDHTVFHRPNTSAWPEAGAAYEAVEARSLAGRGWVGVPVSLDRSERMGVAWLNEADRSVEPYSGRVWCVTVPTGAFLARRNGRVFCTGNSGFPKSLNIAKAIDKAKRGVPQGGPDPTSANHGKFKSGCSDESPTGRGFEAGPGRFMAEPGEREDDAHALHPDAEKWRGWGTALKPAWEPILVARKPLAEGSVAANVLAHGTGGINIDATRVIGPKGEGVWGTSNATINAERKFNSSPSMQDYRSEAVETDDGMIGRHPANVVHDESDEVMALFGAAGERKSGAPGVRRKPHATVSMAGTLAVTGKTETGYGDSGSVARFFYSAKANKADRAGSAHPTVKPLALMRWLVRMAVPPGGTVLDPFAGSGSTGQAAAEEGFNALLIEREPEFAHDIARRCRAHMPSAPDLLPLPDKHPANAAGTDGGEDSGETGHPEREDLDALFGSA